MTAVILIIAAALLITVNYCVLILRITAGVKRLSQHYRDSQKYTITETDLKLSMITVLVAARNEEQYIHQCLESLINQDYPKDNYEIIIIDDQSSDRTSEIINKSIASSPGLIKLLRTTGKGGKKEAIRIGLSEAKGEIILTTDADCVVPPAWISQYNMTFGLTGASFVSGPVMMYTDGSCFSTFQALEFNSLIASTAGLIAIGNSVMSNGANMGFTLKALKEVESFKTSLFNSKEGDDILQKDKASGEDVFTLLSIKKYLGRDKISFIYSNSAVVMTEPQSGIKDFLKQRIRWVSKSSGYRDFDAIYTALSVFGMNFILLILPLFLSIIALLAVNTSGYYILLLSFLISFFLKIIADYRLLNQYSSDIGQKNLLRLLPLMEPLVIIYTGVTGLLGNFLSFEWKGRRYKK